jgi:outer membrane protein OmpA-like peptidoglycan-associated protein
VSGKSFLMTSLEAGNEDIMMLTDGKKKSLNINTPENEGTQSLTADGNMLYFTGCGQPDNIGRCDIYVTYRISDSLWSQPINLGYPVNSEDWEAQPAISPDGSKLFFASNRSGGKGRSDIWCSTLLHRLPDGSQYWSEPVNLYINTVGDEMAPYLYYDAKTLFFSSTSYSGEGGMDIFKVDLKAKTKPENLGSPINTSKNEMGIAIDADGKKVYFTADSGGRKAIYTTFLSEELQCPEVSYMNFTVTDENGRHLLPDKLLLQSYTTGDTLAWYDNISSNRGMLSVLQANNEVLLTVLKKGYLIYSEVFNTGKASRNQPLEKKIVMRVIAPETTAVLHGIFFEHDSYKLSNKSIDELNQLVEFLKINPKVKIEISGHTDNTGTSEYNFKLSEQRAIEVYKYLFINRIRKERMTYKGYGATKPIANNSTEEGRSENRRTEIKIK